MPPNPPNQCTARFTPLARNTQPGHPRESMLNMGLARMLVLWDMYTMQQDSHPQAILENMSPNFVTCLTACATLDYFSFVPLIRIDRGIAPLRP